MPASLWLKYLACFFQDEYFRRCNEEGEWGLDFILKTRLDDGDRITSAGITRWTDNRIGNMDDAVPRIHNSPYDNFLITGILAMILRSLPEAYSMRPQLLQVVKYLVLAACILANLLQ